MKLLSDNIALITGVANENSLAWPIAKTAHLHGARVVLSYRGEAEGRRAKKLAVKIGATTLPCDFTVKEEVEDLFAKIEKTGKLRYAVHSIAFSDRDELQGAFLDGSEQNFSNTMLVSCYSFIHMARHCARLMKQNTEIGENGDCGSIVGLTYA
ncbi:MAG: SDR family oxidoreductase, partial [Patescibacteria group bacterium]|nr:SDR family oxidoreductase [Patescibacteria group bacterium]